MSSNALEKSLDEIIGDRPSGNRRGAPRARRGGSSRNLPYARDSRDSRPRNDWANDDRPRDGERWSHDKYDSSRGRNDNDDRRSFRSQGNGRDSRATRLKVSNIHYDLTENEVRDLFERIAPVSRFSMRFDRAGRSEGVAFVTYDSYRDAKLAVDEFDGQSALGQRLEVELDSVVAPPRDYDGDLRSRIHTEPRERRDDRRQTARRGRGRDAKAGKSTSTQKRGAVTADDLDAELDNYINQRNGGDTQKVADTGAGANGGNDGMLID